MATLQISSCERSRRGLACDHGQRRRVITESLLFDIFQGRLSAGQHLVINDLARRYDVSPTPVREALVALEGIGVVDVFPNRGAVVRRLTVVDAREICDVRRALECEAVRLASGRIARNHLQRLADACRRIQTSQRATAKLIDRSRELDSELHDSIAAACGNRLLLCEINRLTLLFRAFRDAAWRRYAATRDHHRIVEEAREHLEIVEYLLADNAPQASRSMARHINGGLRFWISAIPE